MPGVIDFRIDAKSGKALLETMRKFPKDFASKHHEAILRAGAKKIMAAAKAEIPIFQFERIGKTPLRFDSQDIANAMNVAIRKGLGRPYAVIGPDLQKNKNAWWGHWIEFGTLNFRVKTLKGARRRTAIPLARRAGMGLGGQRKKAFMRIGVERGKGAALAAMTKRGKTELAKFAKP